MKKYKINVNGKIYEIEVEEVTGETIEEKPQTQNKTFPKLVENAPSNSQTPSSGENVNAPMPGTIVAIKVKEGQSVKTGELLVILEAMKMENEILAPKDGKVESIKVSQGANVALGDALITIA